jgi:ribonucleoside-diphosphate reductase beta chain
MKKLNRLFDVKEDHVSQLVQSPNYWALELWEKGCANNWMPQTIDMSQDIEQWRDKALLTDDERLIVKRTLGLFSAGESLVSNSITEAESKYITDGACKQYMLRKAFEESLHNYTVKMCVEAYGLDVNEVAEAYLNIPTISKKEKFLSAVLGKFEDPSFDITTTEGIQLFTKNLFVIYLICEGIWFFPNFALIMSLGRQNKLIGLYDQIKYTIRDETLHVEFGVKLINQIAVEYPEIWTPEFKDELIELMKVGVEIEKEYSKEILPNGILGVNSDMLNTYVEFLANERLASVNLKYKFPSDKNPFPFLGETQDGDGMAAFFERREKNYRNASVLEDDL